MSSYESLRFDGMNIDHFAGSFTGTFDLEENYPIDSEVSFIVVAKVTGAQVQTTKLGDLKRINKMEVVEVSVTGSGSTRRNRAAANQIAGQLSLADDDDDESHEETFEEEFKRELNERSAETVAAVRAERDDELDDDDVFTPPAGPGARAIRDKALSRFLTEA